MTVLGRWGVIGLLCGVGLLTGCSSGEPEAADPTPAVVEPSEAPESVEPSPEPTAEDTEEQHVAAAKQVIVEQLEASWALGNDGFKDLGSMARFWGTPQLAESMSAMLLTSYESGRYTEGVGEIVSQTVTAYDGSGEQAQVRLDVCVDFTGIRNFDASGPMSSSGATRMLYMYLVAESLDGTWKINEIDQDPSREC